MAKSKSFLDVFRRKGGAGSGPHDGVAHPHIGTPRPGHNAHTNDVHKPTEGKPSNYSERPSTRLPGHPRAGVRPSDLYPERKPKS